MKNIQLYQTCGAAKRRDYVDPNKYDVRYRIEGDWHVSEHDDPDDHGLAIMTFKTREGALRYLKLLRAPGDFPKFRIVRVVAKSRKIGKGIVKPEIGGGYVAYRDAKGLGTAATTYQDACDILRAHTKKGKSK